MRLSTRNQLSGTITEVNVGAVMATVLVKSTEVMIGVD